MNSIYLGPKWYCFSVALFLTGVPASSGTFHVTALCGNHRAENNLEGQNPRWYEQRAPLTSRELSPWTSAEDILWCYLWVYLLPTAIGTSEGLEDVCGCVVMAAFKVRVVSEAGTKEWQSNCGGLASFLPVGRCQLYRSPRCYAGSDPC